jgi:sec-independent protein translocase protein TatB
MDILNIGGPELAVILLLALIILGPERIVPLARNAGRFIHEARTYIDRFSQELNSELEASEDLKELKDVGKQLQKDLSVPELKDLGKGVDKTLGGDELRQTASELNKALRKG